MCVYKEPWWCKDTNPSTSLKSSIGALKNSISSTFSYPARGSGIPNSPCIQCLNDGNGNYDGHYWIKCPKATCRFCGTLGHTQHLCPRKFCETCGVQGHTKFAHGHLNWRQPLSEVWLCCWRKVIPHTFKGWNQEETQLRPILTNTWLIWSRE